MDSPRIGICILNFHQPKLTLDCLDSLAKQTYRHFKVFLIDNDTEGEFDKPQLTQYSFLHYHSESTNTGFAGGNNIAIKQALKAGCDYIILLNNDTHVAPDFLKTFIHHASHQSATDILGCNIVYLKQPDKIWFAGGRLYQPFLLTQHFLMNQPIQKTHHLPKLRQTDWLTGCTMGMKQEFFRQVGFFDETFFAYLEDVDLCLRAKLRGGKCLIINQPLVKHAVSPAIGISGSNKFTDKKLSLQITNSIRLLRKHGNDYINIKIIGNILCQAIIYLIQHRIGLYQIRLITHTIKDRHPL